MSNDQQKTRNFKVVVLGNGTVGKSSMIHRCCSQVFKKEYKQTVGCEFYHQSYPLPKEITAKLEIWDIGG